MVEFYLMLIIIVKDVIKLESLIKIKCNIISKNKHQYSKSNLFKSQIICYYK